METDLINASDSESKALPNDALVIAALRGIEPPGLPRFRLGLRIQDEAGVREVFVSSDALTVGSSEDDTITVTAPGVRPAHLRLWRHALVLVGAQFQPGPRVEVAPFDGEAHPLAETGEPLGAGTTLRLGGAELQVIFDAAPAPATGDFHGLVGRARTMAALYLQIAQFSRSEIAVLIQGASGTGKEAVAKALHLLGPRAAGKFVPVNCGAYTGEHLADHLFGHEKGAFTGAISAKPGMFEEADGGVLFLDEVGDLPLHLQGLLLRALQEGEVFRLGATVARQVKVRVVAASNIDVVKAMRTGRFREDLYHRLAGATLYTPRLIDRLEDLPRLVEFFLAKHPREGAPLTLEPEAWQALLHYGFPGNVRQLGMMLEAAAARVAADGLIRVSDLSFSTLGASNGEAPEVTEAVQAEVSGDRNSVLDVRDMTEAEVIVEVRRMALRRFGGNKTAAAEALGLARRTMSEVVE